MSFIPEETAERFHEAAAHAAKLLIESVHLFAQESKLEAIHRLDAIVVHVYCDEVRFIVEDMARAEFYRVARETVLRAMDEWKDQ